MINFIQKNKLPVILAVAILATFLVFYFLVIKTPAFLVSIDEKDPIYISDKAELNKQLAALQREKESKYNKGLAIDSKINVERVFVAKSILVSPEELAARLAQEVRFSVKAVDLIINGEKIASLESQELAEKLIDQFKEENTVIDEGETLIEVKIEEDIDIRESRVAIYELLDFNQAYDLITTGTKNPEKYVVKEGDSLWLIARKNDMYVDDIIKTNRLKSEQIKPGQELVLEKSKPYITVAARVKGEKDEPIPFETEVIVDNSLPSSLRVKQYGKNGLKHISYEVVKRNGTVEEKEILDEKVISQAVNKIILKGTQVTVASRGGGTGALDWPVYGQITKYYRGTSHTGLDIANSSGTPIKAADSGYVTYTGYRGGYGNFVIIDHGNGMVTRYAHCSSFKTSAGQNVSRGDIIATVGSTGNSSGPHLHFEVMVNGGFDNPLDYLR
ncbi:MAG: peptidoglycan DD-metalloendopeptidase family protein [Syntrophomonadaceae bacterium]